MATKNHDTAVEHKTVTITRTFNQSPEKIWKAWTDPETLKNWYGPKDYTCPSCTIDLKVGGKMLASMKGPDGNEIWGTGKFIEIVPNKKLVYEDNFSDSKGNIVPPSFYNMPGEWSDVIVTVTLEPADGKTKMTMQQKNIPVEVYDDCVNGWQQMFDKLEEM